MVSFLPPSYSSDIDFIVAMRAGEIESAGATVIPDMLAIRTLHT